MEIAFMKTFSKVVSGVVLALVLAGAGASMSGCETVKGAGKDIQNAGEAGEKAISGDK
jgi:predicted small secreted protein